MVVNDVEENVASSGHIDYICADNVLEKKL